MFSVELENGHERCACFWQNRMNYIRSAWGQVTVEMSPYDTDVLSI